MNPKPTLVKSTVSLIGGFVLGLAVSKMLIALKGPWGECLPSGLCEDYVIPISITIVPIIISIIVFYLILSIFIPKK